MRLSRSIFSLVSVAIFALSSAAAHAYRETVDDVSFFAATAFAFAVDLFHVAFPLSAPALLDGAPVLPARSIGRAQTRSFRSRVLARMTDDRARAPLAAAFVTA